MKLDAEGLLNAMMEGVVALDRRKKVIFANRSLRRMLFQEEGERIDLGVVQEILDENLLLLPNHATLLDRVMQSREKVSNYETVLRDANGSAIPVQIQISLLLNEADEAIGVLEIIRNLSPSLSEKGEKQNRPFAFRSMVGRSKKILEVLDLVASASASNATVLLEGESGSGKELIARAIHQTGPRRDKPFIA
ncbi:MAG TPA: sigma 54-interacting transcriptional regulator, partial [Candidatus Manganitrophaceae bacterium]|nr:sigma 54-interacting transcriptional regulator [Candidatus Manganitrophaceae bacterium]